MAEFHETCLKCGHKCPEIDPCDKCGGDPMEPGDKLCVECDRIRCVEENPDEA